MKEKLKQIETNSAIHPRGIIVRPEDYDWLIHSILELESQNELLRKIRISQGNFIEHLDKQINPERYKD